MNYKAVFFLLGCVCLIVAAFLVLPALIAIAYGEHDVAVDFVLSALFGALAGLVMVIPTRGSRVGADGRPDYFRREGLAVVGLSWLVAGVIGAIPYLMTRTTDSPVDAIFETVSGFTTTGSTILSGEEIVGPDLARVVAEARQVNRILQAFPTHYPPFRSALLGDDGWIWIEQDLDPDTRRWLVLSPDAMPAFELVMPARVKLKVVSRDEIWAVVPDADDLEHVMRYRVE